jgi:hypothetical protein
MGDAARVIMSNAVIDEILSKNLVEHTVSYLRLSNCGLMSNMGAL